AQRRQPRPRGDVPRAHRQHRTRGGGGMSTSTVNPAVPGQPATSPKAESALPTHATIPSRIPGARPTTGIPFARLVQVELRKMLDTRAGRWLVIGVGVVVAAALTILF